MHATARGRPKNLIFASPDKPDLRFRDALDNDVEIVTNADKVLVYDRPIGNEGLRWSDLQQWWGDTEQIADAIVDGLRGYLQAIEAVFPQAQIHTCIVHLICNSTTLAS